MHKCFSNIIYFEELNSSSDYLIDLYKNFPFQDVATVYADKQIQGRGRMGRSWFSNKDDGLTFSFSIYSKPRYNPFEINMLISISIINFLRSFNIMASVKYPNDIIVDNKKIAGALVEIISILGKRYIVSGIGLNVNNTFFPDDILDAISMKQITFKTFNKLDLFRSLMSYIIKSMSIYSKNKYLIKNSYIDLLLGSKSFTPCLYKNEKFYVRILSCTNTGLITVLRKDLKTFTVNSEDIKFSLC